MTMAYPTKIVYASTMEEGKEHYIKNRVARHVNGLYEKYCLPEDDVSEFVFHYDRRTRQVYQITILDSGIGRGGFKSNLNYEGQITELLKENQSLKNQRQGHKMREGRHIKKVDALEQMVELLEQRTVDEEDKSKRTEEE
jgi:hypothetical protein